MEARRGQSETKLKRTEAGGTAYFSEKEAREWSAPNFRMRRTINGLTRFIETKLDLKSESKAIDLGCGSGVYSFVLAKRAHSVVGVDASPAMLALARKQKRERARRNRFKNKNLRFVKGDYFRLRLRFAANSFDAAVSLGPSIMGTEKNPLALKELARILKPGGKAVLDVRNPLHPSYWLPNPFHNLRRKMRAALFPWQLRKHFKENGFVLLAASSVNYLPPGCPRFAAPLFYFLESVCTKLPLLKFLGRHLVVLVAKAGSKRKPSKRKPSE